MGLSGDYTGARFDDAGHFTRLGETAHLTLLATTKLGDGFELFGRIENLSDNRREAVAGYGVPGRAFYAGIRSTL